MKIGGAKGFLPYMAVAKGIAGSLSGPSDVAVNASAPDTAIPCCFVHELLAIGTLQQSVFQHIFTHVRLLIAHTLSIINNTPFKQGVTPATVDVSACILVPAARYYC